jgi:hypothetical protein
MTLRACTEENIYAVDVNDSDADRHAIANICGRNFPRRERVLVATKP